MLYPWLALMYRVRVEKLKRIKKYEPIARLVIGVVHDKYFVLRRWSITTLYDFVGITFFSHYILKRHDCFISTLEVLLFLCQTIDYCFESYGSEYSCHNRRLHDKHVM